MKSLVNSNPPRDLRAVRFPPGLNVVVAGPHPDDFDAVGVTLRMLYAQEHRIHVLINTVGSGVEDDFCGSPSLAVKAAVRVEEQRRSCRFFGLSDGRMIVHRLDDDDEAEPLETSANLERIRNVLEPLRPDLVFIPHGNDQKPGHRRNAAMVRQVICGLGREVTLFQNRDVKTISMRTDCYMPYGPEEARWKAELLRFHESQQHRNLKTRGSGFDARILDGNRSNARDLGLDVEFAECFEVDVFG